MRTGKTALLRNSVSVLAATLFLAACASSGGTTNSGGGGTTTGTTAGGSGSGTGGGTGGGTPPPTAASFKTAEYFRSWALDAIGAADAYALGFTGKGVTIGVVDFNFALSSSEVKYAGASVGPNSQAIAWYEAVIGPGSTDDLQHGHAVAATAAALKNNNGIHGVAFDATVLGVDYFANVNATQIVQGRFTYHISDPWTYLTSRGVKIINKSYGYDDGDGVAVPGGVTELYVNEDAVVAIANGALLVASAGNKGDKVGGFQPIKSNRDIVEGIVANNFKNGPGAFMIVGSVKQTISGYQISSFSNRAGTYADYFIVAPGEDVAFPLNAPECAPSFLCVGSGTSFSSPLVAGAAALVLQHWPQLTARAIADILFASATDLGAPGPDAIYGRGMLNVFAALQPIGVTTLAVQNGAAFSAESSGLLLGDAFGDAPQLRAALQVVPIRDSFARDFGIDLSGLVLTAPGANLAGIMQQQSRWHGAAYRLGVASGVTVQLFDKQKIPFQALNGLEEPDAYRGVVQFNGKRGAIAWTAGSGLALSTALDSDHEDANIAPLTRAFGNMLETRTGYFATAQIALNERTHLSFGMSQAHSENVFGATFPALDRKIRSHLAGLRLDYAAPRGQLSFETGSAWEEGGILGSKGVGALNIGARSASLWTRFGGDTRLNENWSLKASTSLAMTMPSQENGNLVASIAPIISTAASFGIARSDLISSGDILSFTLHQPLRVERAQMTLFTAGTASANGATASLPREISLTSSGREIAFELGYGGNFGVWRTQFNIAYRHDAGHVAGENGTAVMLWLSRGF